MLVFLRENISTLRDFRISGKHFNWLILLHTLCLPNFKPRGYFNWWAFQNSLQILCCYHLGSKSAFLLLLFKFDVFGQSLTLIVLSVVTDSLQIKLIKDNFWSYSWLVWFWHRLIFNVALLIVCLDLSADTFVLLGPLFGLDFRNKCTVLQFFLCLIKSFLFYLFFIKLSFHQNKFWSLRNRSKRKTRSRFRIQRCILRSLRKVLRCHFLVHFFTFLIDFWLKELIWIWE